MTTANNSQWISFEEKLPPEDILVETKIDDLDGIRNETKLIRQGNLMYTSDKIMYVYYTPTHWRFIS